MSLFEKKQEQKLENQVGLPAKTRAAIWLILSATVFLCAVVMCLVLIGKSASDEHDPLNNIEMHVEDIKYVANATQSSDTPLTSEDTEVELTAPKSVNDSTMLNILLVGVDVDSELTDTMMLISIDTEKALPSMLSVPRDTYIAGDYDVPKVNRIYKSNGSRGADALKEAVENMVGFRIDKHMFFDESALTDILSVTGPIDFEIPEEPDYHDLPAGKQSLKDEKAFELFRYTEEYTDVETEPYKVQRSFVAAIADTLLADQENLYENAETICNATQTDLTPAELAYLGNLLKNARFAASFSRALPGGEITIDDVDYYQVDAVSACELLNAHFNPLDTTLTEYDVHFRQLQGDSGEGEMPDWGFGGPHPTTNPDEPDPTEETSEDTTDEPEPIEPIEPTDPPAPSDPEPIEPIEPNE
ncbi:MAG: LytR family transcriptional regulator [Ruminococcaceae bacterium]|nr:LytR family transcriptional regulator [Oscillospiraceae bacterium]